MLTAEDWTLEKISLSVGKAGQNRNPDVVIIQTLLNQCLAYLIPRVPQQVTGICDGLTIEIIKDFQLRVLRSLNPDGRVDPGGRTLDALNTIASGKPYIPKPAAPPPSGGRKIYTTNPNEVNTVHTAPSASDVVSLLKQNWAELTSNGARTLTAQFMHETGGGKYCFNWNLGNVKSGPNELHMYLNGVWEVDSPEAAASQVAKSGGLGRIATGDEIKKKGWSCPPGKNVVVFQPPHAQCRFRAYPSLQDGAQKWLGRHKALAQRNTKYLAEVNSGDTAAVAKSLKKDGYYTGGEADYARSMKSQKAAIDKALGPA